MEARAMKTYSNVIRAVLTKPWAIYRGSVEWGAIKDVLELRAAGIELSQEEVRARLAARPQRSVGSTPPRPQVAVIPVWGVLMPRASLMAELSGASSVSTLKTDFRDALADDSVGSIVFAIDSPGGLVDGIPEFAREIREARGTKPIVAVSDTFAASAAYWIASQADELYVTDSGEVGSIGVFTEHEDWSKFWDDVGMAHTFIQAGEFKTEGNEFEALAEDTTAYIQSQVDHYYRLFISDVAAGRGISEAQVKADYGQGRMLVAPDALAAGMVDGIATLESVVAREQAQIDSGEQRPAAFGYRGIAVASRGAAGMAAGAIGRHTTATSDDEWDAGENERRLPNERGPLRAAHAWVEDDADPDAKSSYKFIHHEVATNGTVGAANTRACSNGIGILNGGRGGADIPSEDRQGVHNHLGGHLRDADMDVPDLKAQAAIVPLDVELAAIRARQHRRSA
jgi:signal peptide peptidase SppA